jgi:hypothetical protein
LPGRARSDERDDGIEIIEDELVVDAEDAPAELRERTIPPRVRRSASRRDAARATLRSGWA